MQAKAKNEYLTMDLFASL